LCPAGSHTDLAGHEDTFPDTIPEKRESAFSVSKELHLGH